MLQLVSINLKVLEKKYFFLNGLASCFSQMHQPPLVWSFNSALKHREVSTIGSVSTIGTCFYCRVWDVSRKFIFNGPFKPGELPTSNASDKTVGNASARLPLSTSSPGAVTILAQTIEKEGTAHTIEHPTRINHDLLKVIRKGNLHF